MILSMVEQYYDDRLFEIYNLNNLFATDKLGFTEYKQKLSKANSKVDIDKVKKDTDDALNDFIKSLKKEGD